MNATVLLRRQPIVNRVQELAGYDLALISPHGEHAAAGGLAALLAGEQRADGFFVRMPNRFALAECTQVEVERAEGTSAGRFVVSLRAEDLPDDPVALARRWRAAGFGLCVDCAQAASPPAELLELAGYLRLDAGQPDGSMTRLAAHLRRHPGKQIASGTHSRSAFDAAVQAGCELFQGYFFLEPWGSDSQTGSPGYNTIVGLMKLTRDDAPVAKIEEALKRDAALSFKLLRYINSVGFGLSCEIQSFKHAVAVLGYQNLYKWLALLLVTAAREQGCAALVTTAVTRGRLAELLGQALFDAHERDNLFLAGAFSLLHVILGLPLEKITEQVALPESVTDALSHRAGPFGPILELVELLERLEEPGKAARADALALSLGLHADAVNRAHLDAVVWAEGLGR
jgi:EAL and modified HD-GYP domain-containing signal transduction protein